MKRIKSILFIVLLAVCSCKSSDFQEIDKFGIFEASFRTSGNYQNPYTELLPEAELTRPDGSKWKIPLFWDGEDTWKLRVSPDMEGKWIYRIESTDRGLKRRKGSFMCKASGLKGTIGPMSKYPEHFQYSNGDRFWFLGETAWALFNNNEKENLDRSAFEHYVKTRASQGFNVMHAMVLSEAGWGNSGGMPFHDMEKQVMNPAYWKEIDSRIDFANRNGIVIGLVLAWGDKNKKVPYPWRLFPGIEARKNYARYIAARYSAFNVYFIVSGEWHAEIRTRSGNEEDIRNEFIETGNALDEADPHNRMIGIHPMTGNGSVREFNRAGWMSFGDYQQNYSRLHSRILESMMFNKPVVNSEYGYYLRDQNGDGVTDKDNSTSLESIRYASWDIVMAGAYLVTGFGTTYFGGNRDPGPFDVDAVKNDEWELQVGYIKKFFEKTEYWKMSSHDDLLVSETLRGSDGRHLGRTAPPLTTYWLFAESGRQYLLYARGVADKISLSLKSGDSGKYKVQLFNPRTGEMNTINENMYLSSDYNWTPPDKNDWVIYLLKISDL